jgi:GGDEF domain-containing protein
MSSTLTHDIELYPLDVFSTLLDHEVNKSRRYGDSLTLIHLAVETNPVNLEAQHSAEVFTINALNIHLRDTDIACKQGNEFLILMPSTSAPGARTACERLKRLMTVEHQTLDRVSFNLSAFIGLATMPIDHSLSSHDLAGNALKALQHARTNHITSVVAFSEIL